MYCSTSEGAVLHFKYELMSRKSEIVFTGRRKILITFIGILALGMFFGGIVHPGIPEHWPLSGYFNSFKVHQGLDLQGGAHLVYEADVSEIPEQDRVDSVEGVRDVIERRVNALGVSEPLVQTNINGDIYRVIIELAGVFDVNDAIQQIGETPLLEFKEQNRDIPATQTSDLTEAEQQQILDSEAAALTEGQEVLTRLQAGEDFETLAREFSDDPTVSENGGDLGFQPAGTYVPEFDDVLINKLQDQQLWPELVKTQFGYHIIERLGSQVVEGSLVVDSDGSVLEGGEDGKVLEVHGRHILFAALTPSDLRPPVDPWAQTGLSGKHLESAIVQFQQQTNAPNVGLTFNEEGKQLFADITKRNLGQPVAIFLDGEPISVPVVQSEIVNGQAVISGNFSIPEAKLLAQRLNAGALPVPIELVSQLQVGPSLGQESVEKSLSAGFWGLIFVMIFMVFVYRLPGLLADIALILYAIILFGLFEFIPVTLTLAGIAGFILSVGMAVDANVLIFERMKEELRNGRSLTTAIEEGFKRAWSSIRDSNISSLITAAILIWFGSSIIKGFALTLSIGILVSMFSAITISRTFLRLIALTPLKKHGWLFGVTRKEE